MKDAPLVNHIPNHCNPKVLNSKLQEHPQEKEMNRAMTAEEKTETLANNRSIISGSTTLSPSSYPSPYFPPCRASSVLQ